MTPFRDNVQTFRFFPRPSDGVPAIGVDLNVVFGDNR